MTLVVLIDDDELSHLVLARRLKKADWLLESFDDALDALAWLDANGLPDLLVIDQRMPRMDGHELIQHLAAGHDLSSRPVFLSSAHEPPAEVRSAVEALGVGIAPKELTRTLEGLRGLLERSLG